MPSERVAKAVEAAVGLLGNASCHISALRRTKILERYNKDLVTWAQDREPDYLKAVWGRILQGCHDSGVSPLKSQISSSLHTSIIIGNLGPAHKGGATAASGAGRRFTHQ